MTIKTDPAQCRVFRTRALETGIKERTFKFERAQETNEENRTMRISVASEYPVDRWGDKEILSHSPGAQKIGERQQSMPLLFKHPFCKNSGRRKSLFFSQRKNPDKRLCRLCGEQI